MILHEGGPGIRSIRRAARKAKRQRTKNQANGVLAANGESGSKDVPIDLTKMDGQAADIENSKSKTSAIPKKRKRATKSKPNKRSKQ